MLTEIRVNDADYATIRELPSGVTKTSGALATEKAAAIARADDVVNEVLKLRSRDEARPFSKARKAFARNLAAKLEQGRNYLGATDPASSKERVVIHPDDINAAAWENEADGSDYAVTVALALKSVGTSTRLQPLRAHTPSRRE